jgi:hypothetical protein
LLPGQTEPTSGKRNPYHVETSIVNMNKDKVVPVRTIKTFGSESISTRIPNLGTR